MTEIRGRPDQLALELVTVAFSLRDEDPAAMIEPMRTAIAEAVADQHVAAETLIVLAELCAILTVAYADQQRADPAGVLRQVALTVQVAVP